MITKLTRHQLNQDRARLEEFIQGRRDAYAKNCAPTEAHEALRENDNERTGRINDLDLVWVG